MTTNEMVSLRPFVILAIRMMRPGRRRLEMVRLVHDLNDARGDVRPFQGGPRLAARPQPDAIRSQQRAA
jgi:hypothetical protein